MPKTTRRTFLQSTGASALCLGFAGNAPAWVPHTVLGQTPPSDRIVIGHIGLGWRGFELVRQTFRNPNLRIAAVADLDLAFLMKRLQFLDDQASIDRPWIKGEGWDCLPAPTPAGGVDPYLDYRYLLDRQDIDAVVIAVPDHWHAKTYIDALDAGKDVYGEKPLTLTINQGRAVVRKVQETGRVFQTGLQQRSDPLFRTACEYVRNGRLGTLKRIRILIRGTNVIDPVPDAPVPPGLDWDRWLGPAPKVPTIPCAATSPSAGFGIIPAAKSPISARITRTSRNGRWAWTAPAPAKLKVLPAPGQARTRPTRITTSGSPTKTA